MASHKIKIKITKSDIQVVRKLLTFVEALLDKAPGSTITFKVDSEESESTDTESDDEKSSIEGRGCESISSMDIDLFALRLSSYVFHFQQEIILSMNYPEDEPWDEFLEKVDMSEVDKFIENNGLSKADWIILNEFIGVTKWDGYASGCLNVEEGFSHLKTLVNDKNSVYQKYCTALGHLLEYFKKHPLPW